MLTVPLQINGKDVSTSKTLDVTNPSTGKVIHKASSASVSDAISAVEAAQAAFASWRETTPAQKRAIFSKAADILERRTDEAGKLEEEEIGARPSFAGGFDVPTAVGGLRDVAGKIGTLEGTYPQLGDPNRSAIVLKEPFGVILGIAPW